MKAITTKFHGPTNTLPARITASDLDGNRITVSIDYGLSHDCNHAFAAVALCNKMEWKGELVQGSLDSSREVFVFTGRARNRAASVRRA